jgi:multidrug efflux pump subunit AcrB
MLHTSDTERIHGRRNTARFFTEERHIAWVLLIATLVWGAWGYLRMPQRKDPDIPVRQALAIGYWPGASSERIEELVTRRLEEEIAKNARVERIESVSRTGVSLIYLTLDEAVPDRAKEFDDINLKLASVRDLPDGAGPVVFVKDFGDTAALMLTVASPKIGDAELVLRAATLRRALDEVRATAPPLPARVSIVHGLPDAVAPQVADIALRAFARRATADGVLHDARLVLRPGFMGVDGVSMLDDEALLRYTRRFIESELKAAEIHPDAWPPAVIRDLAATESRLAAVAGDKYTYRDLDDYTDVIARTLKSLPMVAKVERRGLLEERVFLDYSQERLAAYGVRPSALDDVLRARNITVPGGVLEIQGKTVTIDPSGEFLSEREIGDVLVPSVSGGAVYLRDLVNVVRAYASPPRYLNFHSRRDPDGEWRRTRAVTLSVQMKSGAQIGAFAQAVDATLDDLRQRLPEDLVLARTSDQPRQVSENVSLFMRSLEEAVVLVVLVSLIGFWEWRSALLMALSIPLTLAMTFGMMHTLGIDLQQVSIASLIIALGLLVDDPVVAGDAIKRELAAGHPPAVAAWLGPTKLATAILFATVTNIVAYLPFLALPGDTGRFLYSLPIVITCSLVASRLVSMTFIPLLGYYLLKPHVEPTAKQRRESGFAAHYYRFGRFAIAHRWAFLACSLVLLALGGVLAGQLKRQFFPQDHQYLSFVDVWMPDDAPLAATRAAADEVELVVRQVADALSVERAQGEGPRPILKSITTFLGGGAPRFWFSAAPEQSQLNYAQVLIEVHDKHDTATLAGPLQRALSATVPDARIDVRRLETGPAIGIPVAVRISGDDIPTLRRLAAEARAIFEAVPAAARVRDNWGSESFSVQLETDADRANFSGVTNLDVAASSATGMNGFQVGVLRDGDKQIPIVARMRMEERAQLGDVQNLYVYSMQGPQKIPLGSISSVSFQTRLEKLHRRNQFRTITVAAFAEPGYLPSEVLEAARPGLDRLAQTLPPGYGLQIGGEYEEQIKGFRNQAIVMAMSVTMIFLALVVQFRHAVKPFIVFAAIPFGIVGAFVALRIMDAPFGFMAFLGVASLVGVIVSHIIVLFDFIEEARERGEPLVDAVLDAGIVRLRPVLITVAATVIALFPLAANGGPLWEPMCYAQIGGLTFATFVTLVLVPVLYAVFVLDLKWVDWPEPPPAPAGAIAAGAA